MSEPYQQLEGKLRRLADSLQPTEDSHEIHMHPVPPVQWQMVGPAHRIVNGPGGSDGTDQVRGPDQDA